MTNLVSVGLSPFKHERFRIRSKIHQGLRNSLYRLVTKIEGKNSRLLKYLKRTPIFQVLSLNSDPACETFAILVSDKHLNAPWTMDENDLRVLSFHLDPRVDIIEATGKYYGYADCCIANFKRCRSEGTDVKGVPADLDHTGFYPCPVCQTYPVPELIAAINSRRVSAREFPISSYSNSITDIMHRLVDKGKVT